MNRLSRDQKGLVSQFVAVAGCSDKAATTALKAANWNLQTAINTYYQSGGTSAPAGVNIDEAALTAVFEKYKDPNADSILVDGMAQYCQDLEVDPMDVIMLVVAFYLNAGTMCEFTRTEFINGWTQLGCDSIDKMKDKLPEMRRNVFDDETRYGEFYSYTYDFGREPGQKSLSVEMAIALWNLVLVGKFELLDQFVAFLGTQKQAVSKDTWDLVLDFVRQVKPDMSNYDDDGAWPVLLDEFVEYVRENQ